MWTVKQIADELGLSKPAVLTRIDKLGLRQRCEYVGKKELYPDDVAAAVIDFYRQQRGEIIVPEPGADDQGADDPAGQEEKNNFALAVMAEKAAALESEIELLREELRQKNEQINSLLQTSRQNSDAIAKLTSTLQTLQEQTLQNTANNCKESPTLQSEPPSTLRKDFATTLQEPAPAPQERSTQRTIIGGIFRKLRRR